MYQHEDDKPHYVQMLVFIDYGDHQGQDEIILHEIFSSEVSWKSYFKWKSKTESSSVKSFHKKIISQLTIFRIAQSFQCTNLWIIYVTYFSAFESKHAAKRGFLVVLLLLAVDCWQQATAVTAGIQFLWHHVTGHLSASVWLIWAKTWACKTTLTLA